MDREHVKGAADKAKGAIKDAAGKVTGDKELQTEGKLDKAKGDAHNTGRRFEGCSSQGQRIKKKQTKSVPKSLSFGTGFFLASKDRIDLQSNVFLCRKYSTAVTIMRNFNGPTFHSHETPAR